MAEYTKTDRSFVYEYTEYMDFCRHPDLVTSVSQVPRRDPSQADVQNGEMIMESEHIMRPLAPILAVSRVSRL